MKKREDIVQKFSTFLKFGDIPSGTVRDRKSIWQTDPRLERQMKRLVQSDPEAKAEFWARYFLKTLRELSQQENSTEAGDMPSGTLRSRTYSLATTSSQTLDISTLIIATHLSAYLQEACLWAAQKSYYKHNFLRCKYPLEEYFQIASSVANLPAKLLKNFNLAQK